MITMAQRRFGRPSTSPLAFAKLVVDLLVHSLSAQALGIVVIGIPVYQGFTNGWDVALWYAGGHAAGLLGLYVVWCCLVRRGVWWVA